jgi:hypothetical protein
LIPSIPEEIGSSGSSGEILRRSPHFIDGCTCPLSNINGYGGLMAPTEGCKVIVKAALGKGGKNHVFIHKDGQYPW